MTIVMYVGFGLNTLEVRLSQHRFLLGDRLTQADLRLFTVVQSDTVYYGAFNCNLRDLVDYPSFVTISRENKINTCQYSVARVTQEGDPNLWDDTRHLYDLPCQFLAVPPLLRFSADPAPREPRTNKPSTEVGSGTVLMLRVLMAKALLDSEVLKTSFEMLGVSLLTPRKRAELSSASEEVPNA